MDVLLAVLIVSLPLMFILGIGYFIELRAYQKRVIDELPDIWNKECSRSIVAATGASTAFRLLQRTRHGALDGHALSPTLRLASKRASALLYAAATCFLVLLFLRSSGTRYTRLPSRRLNDRTLNA